MKLCWYLTIRKHGLPSEVTTMRLISALFLALVPTAANSAQTQIQNGCVRSSPKIELRLVAEQTTIRPGESLKLRVELWNVSSEDVIIAQNVGQTSGNSELQLFLEFGAFREVGSRVIADFVPKSDPDFENPFVTNWLTLNHGHFYGTYIFLDPMDYPHLRKPGRYKVRAVYYSRGISSTSGWNGAYLSSTDVENLPLTAFNGTINSRSIKIRVTARN